MAFWLIQWAKSATERNAYGVPVRNLGKVTEAVWRGALPGREGYEALARVLGVRRVFSLTDRVAKGEKQRALDAGMRDWQHIPFSDREPPNPALVLDWLGQHAHGHRARPRLHALHGRAPPHRRPHRRAARRRPGLDEGAGAQGDDALRLYDALGHGALRRWFLQDFDPTDYAARVGPAPGSELTGISKDA